MTLTPATHHRYSSPEAVHKTGTVARNFGRRASPSQTLVFKRDSLDAFFLIFATSYFWAVIMIAPAILAEV
jgi:hypothetical protein